MAGVTDQGWETKTFTELIEEASARAKEGYGEDFPTTPESVFGELASIISASTKDVWDLGQQVTDSQNRDTASGLYLDYLAELVGLTRQTASGAKGNIWFKGNVGTTVTQATACKDQSGRAVLTDVEGVLNRANCYSSSFTITSVQDETDYTIYVEGVENTVNSGTGSTVTEVLDLLKTSIDANNNTVNTVEDEVLLITYQDYNNTLTTTNSANLTLVSVGMLIASTSAEEGFLEFYPDTITTLVTPNLGIFSVTNPSGFESGRELETDEELRIRMALREQSTGTATKPSIEASISEIIGVTSVLVEVNDTLNDDPVTGIPAKSFETHVSGGAESSIAEVLWRTKPVTGQTHGNISKSIIDDNGDTQGVKFSRPVIKFAWVRVTYTINEEEYFPADGEERMKNAVVSFGSAMTQGEDFEPTKFYAPLYTVQGVYISEIEIAVTDNEGDSPTYGTAKIEVSNTTTLDFTSGRVPVTT